MDFWKNSGHSFRSFAELSDEKLILLLNEMPREDMIAWLAWNDPNGIYHDAQSLKELGNMMSREDGMEIILRQVGENRVMQ